MVLGIANFVCFLGVTALVETPRALAGYGFSATLLSTSIVYLLPGAPSGLVTAPLGGELVARLGPRATLVLSMLPAAVSLTALACFHNASWQVILATLGTFTTVVFGYAAISALLGEHVDRAETGIANSVNSVARTVGSALASCRPDRTPHPELHPGPGGRPAARPPAHPVFPSGVGATVLCALLVAGGLRSHRLRPGEGAGPEGCSFRRTSRSRLPNFQVCYPVRIGDGYGWRAQWCGLAQCPVRAGFYAFAYSKSISDDATSCASSSEMKPTWTGRPVER
ncbi:hypothetical protein ACWDE0_41905 [Streptomyces sp. 900105755]